MSILSTRQMGMESPTSACNWARIVHTKGGQAQTSLHKSWLGGTEKLPLTLPRQGIEPRVFRFEFRLSDQGASSPSLEMVLVRDSQVTCCSQEGWLLASQLVCVTVTFVCENVSEWNQFGISLPLVLEWNQFWICLPFVISIGRKNSFWNVYA